LAVSAFEAVFLATAEATTLTGWASFSGSCWGFTIMGELAIWSGAVLAIIALTVWNSLLLVVFKSASLLGAVAVAVTNSSSSTFLHSLP
jgi:hypothetical protein